MVGGGDIYEERLKLNIMAMLEQLAEEPHPHDGALFAHPGS